MNPKDIMNHLSVAAPLWAGFTATSGQLTTQHYKALDSIQTVVAIGTTTRKALFCS